MADVPIPGVGPRDVLIRVSHCGICGTDLHFVMDGWGRPDSIGGHEYSGSIVAVGSEVSAWSVGDRVVGGGEPGCGRCEACRRNRQGLCSGRSAPGVDEFQGAFAEYVCVEADRLVAVPESLDLREAALCEPLAVALHAMTLSGVREGQRALVTGAGAIGALVVAALKARGVHEIVVSEPSAARREFALRLGASHVTEPESLEVHSSPFVISEGAAHVAFECSGKGQAFEAALCGLGRAGTLVLVGTGMDQPPLAWNRVLLNELTVVGAYNYDDDGFEQAMHLLSSGALPTEHLIHSTDVSLDTMLGACEDLAAGRIAGKVLVSPSL
ncbi:alcohol dehydrogenase catalytic domain-containing protein [Myxococcota bacterium]|nr:alcohol dehydrogenase catalytic domain-containing protein [Myxococcota bacterium]